MPAAGLQDPPGEHLVSKATAVLRPMGPECQAPKSRIGFPGSCCSVSPHNPRALSAPSGLLPGQRTSEYLAQSRKKKWKDPFCFLTLFSFQNNHKPHFTTRSQGFLCVGS